MCVACPEPEAEIRMRIERKRSHMNKLAEELGHVHPAVMVVSQQLDELLLQYYALTRRMRKIAMGGSR